MGILDRIGSAEGVLAFADRLIKWAPTLLGAAVSTWLGGWAASATAALNIYAPASWVFGGLVGAALFMLAYLLWASARVKADQHRFATAYARQFPAVNPLDDTFAKRQIDINVFRRPFAEPIEGKAFVDCEISGPALVAFMGHTTLTNVGFLDCQFVQVKDDAQVFDVIAFKDISIRGGKVYRLTILVPASAAGSIPPSGHWITTHSYQPS